MNTNELKSINTVDLLSRYNKLRAKAINTPKSIRRNNMIGVGNKLQVMLDELHRRTSVEGSWILERLEH